MTIAVRLRGINQQPVIIVVDAIASVGWFENCLQLPPIKEVDLNELKHLLNTEGDTGFEFEPSQDQVSDHDHVELAQDGVF